MNEDSQRTAEQAAAFQKIWVDSVSKTMQTLFTFNPEAVPPEIARQIRRGILEALAKSWDEFMRSPQFLEGMKQWMDQAVTFRKMSNDFLATARSEMQATSRDDIDTVMLTVRHMEKRILDRVDELATQVADLSNRVGHSPGIRQAAPANQARKRRRTPRQRQGAH